MHMAPGFTGSPLERIDNERDHPGLLAARAGDPAALLLRMEGLDPVAAPDGRLEWAPLAEAPAGVELALLGLIDGRPRFVALDPAATGSGHNLIWRLLDGLPDGEAGTYAAARSLVDWHARHRFCARCGNETQTMRAGWARRCGACGAEHFPRTDPVVIMLAEYRGRVLIGRQPRFPAGRYSALAGFVEVGESMEEAVARELFEEAGVRATRVRYVASQPWPFPSSLMMACIADVESDAVTLDANELEHAMWVGRDEVAAALAGDPSAPFIAPPPYAIAHTLFARWLDGAGA
ncbi:MULTISPECIES: NAD(+) diphosphatase [Sphingomonas]|uniref:NAD(+) diphosphatase n=1 Tax=Edaphosphingomonas fennica TaxID=114404 RepID=A0A2T4I6V7_9SPHN|nr:MULTISPECIES: NAD(+) diphosphatase [Sphingomonas]AGH48256.1 NUDIX hydrolase [Sphingomonas sp. MM-1]PTD26342.1 NAD(+) diphosphatase [Sphingomonas fennica]